MPRIHGVNLSPFVRKTRAALAEKGIDCENVPVLPGGGGDPGWRALSPLGKIPVFEEDDGFTVPDSSVIIAYLERTRPEPALYPADPRDHARALFLEEYADTKLAETIGTPFAERIVKGRFIGDEPDEQAVREALDRAPELFDYLESLIEEGAEGIVGGRLSVADLAIASPFVNFHHAGEKIDAARWPRLAGYIATLHARPSFKALIAEERIPSAREMREARAQQIAGPHGDEKLHLPGDVLEHRFEALSAPPTDVGRVALLVSRRENEVRETPERTRLTPEEGMPGDSWGRNTPEFFDAQLAVMRADVAELIANGQPLTLFGDNLLVGLDLSSENLPVGTRLRAGTATLEVTPEPHNGCAKFRGRFGADALKLTADRRFRQLHLRGIYMRVVEAGEVGIGDAIAVLERPSGGNEP
jgi:glutathione S-transferase